MSKPNAPPWKVGRTVTLSRNMDGDVLLVRPGKSTMVIAKVGSDLWNELTKPLDMLLYCPVCGGQHIDKDNLDELQIEAAERGFVHGSKDWEDFVEEREWTNPPHRSHLCATCGCVWRPADMPTNGIERLTTAGKGDTWHPALTWPVARPKGVTVHAEAAQQKLAQEYRRNILEGVANWMRSRHSTIWATEFGYTGLMATWADELDQIRRELDGAADAAKTGGEIRNVEGSGWLIDPLVQLADGVTLSAEDAHFLAVRLRRLCEHLKYALPKFAEDDAALVNIAGTVIGALLANMTYGVQRYKVVTGSQSKHCCFHATVVDTLKPTIIAGKHWNNEFEALCECFSPADAEQIAAVLNATTGVHTPDPFIEHFAKEEATQPHSCDAGGVPKD